MVPLNRGTLINKACVKWHKSGYQQHKALDIKPKVMQQMELTRSITQAQEIENKFKSDE